MSADDRMPADPLPPGVDLVAEAESIGSVLFDGLLDAMRADGLLGLRAVLEFGRSDLERVALAMLIEIFTCGDRLHAPLRDPAVDPPAADPPEPPPGRRVLIEIGSGLLHGGLDEVITRVRAATNAELRAAVIGTLEEAYTKLRQRQDGETE